MKAFLLLKFSGLGYTEYYSEVRQYQGATIRGSVRNFALDMLSTKDFLFGTKTLLLHPRVHFLFIHHIFKDEVQNFEKLLATLAGRYTFVSHSEAVDKVLNDNIDKPYISFSSDDGFKNNMEAAEIMDRFNVKCCFFLNPESIGRTDFDWVKRFCADRLHMPPIEFMDWQDVEDLQKRGHEIGSHTMAHVNVATMTPEQVAEDLSESRRILEAHCGPIAHFAFPYGRFFHFNKPAFDLVFKTGYKSCSTGERGCHVGAGRKLSPSELFIRRDQVIAAWKLKHMLYFLANGARHASPNTNLLPGSYN